MITMGKVETKNVDASFQQGVQLFFAITGGAHSSDNLGATKHGNASCGF
jgi:hypothetical protein